MNLLGAETGLHVVAIAQLYSSAIALDRPILVTQIHHPEHLQQLADWLKTKDLGPSSLIYMTSDGQTLADITAITAEVFPLQAYIPVLVTPETIALQKLIDVVAQLRNPDGGCPWDLEQTPESLIPYIIEEAYETVDAIRQGQASAIADELGDLLLQVVLQSQIATEQERFSLSTVAQGITAKLIRRHPHVFGDVKINSVDEVHANWDKIKAAEKGEAENNPEILSQKLQRYARRLPPLMAGLKLSEKAASAGFEWPDLNGVWAKFYEELAEFQEALLKGDITEQEAELGDLLFTLVNIARWCQIDPASALHQTNLKLIERIRAIETQVDKPLGEYSIEELETFWQMAKRQLSRLKDLSALTE